MYSLRKAAEAAGVGKPAILKAIQKGRISAKKDDHGQWQVDPAELHRVYPLVPGTGSESGSGEREETAENGKGNRLLEREIELLRERLEDKDTVIDDLRGRLDRAEDERRAVNLQLTDLRERESDSRSVAQQVAELTKQLKAMEEKRTGWWGRLLGRG